METLRQWNGESNELLVQHLAQFGVEAEDVNLIKYEELTPDSFIWFLHVREKGNAVADRYCLYAEDYIPGITHVLEVINENVPTWQQESGIKYSKLIRVIEPGNRDDASPADSAAIHKPSEKNKNFMEYTCSSGYDFVFLAR